MPNGARAEGPVSRPAGNGTLRETPAKGKAMFQVKSPRDLGAGLLFILIGLGGFYFGRNLNVGVASRMGPGYFPMLLSGLICFIGLIVIARSFVLRGPPIDRPQIRPLFFVLMGMLTFGWLIERVGLALSVAAIIVIATFARRGKPNPLETALLAVGVAIFAVLTFVYGLGQSIPAWWGK
jgi:hypothetical protein